MVRLITSAVILVIVGMFLFAFLFEDETAQCQNAERLLDSVRTGESFVAIGPPVRDGGSECSIVSQVYLGGGEVSAETIESRIIWDANRRPLVGRGDGAWNERSRWTARFDEFSCDVGLLVAGTEAVLGMDEVTITDSQMDVLLAGQAELVRLRVNCGP